MSDAIDRAAEVIAELVDAEDAAHVLDAEGRLVTPEHDAAVAAKALREAADAAEVINAHAGGGNLVTQVHAVRVSALRDRADRIELSIPDD